MEATKIIVPGGLNTDLIATGVKRLAGKGELVRGRELRVGPGGKSRNIAQMIAALTGPDAVAMIGKTAKDPFGFWKIPLDALNSAGVNTAQVKILEFSGTLPGIALIPVDEEGNNQIYLLPGINDEFSPADIDEAAALFESAGRNSGILALSLELPLETALRAVEYAEKNNLKVVLDPGGIDPSVDYSALLQKDIYLFKPNEHEAEILSGVKVADFQTAKQAARELMDKGIQNVLITAGVNGAYLFSNDVAEYLPIPEISVDSDAKDETGCGDQTMATICAMLGEGKDVLEAAKAGIISGTLQFHRPGIAPVSRVELEPYI